MPDKEKKKGNLDSKQEPRQGTNFLNVGELLQTNNKKTDNPI